MVSGGHGHRASPVRKQRGPRAAQATSFHPVQAFWNGVAHV